MGVSSQKWGLLTVNQHAMRFHNRIAYHEFKGFEFNLFMRDPLLKDIEGYKVALLRNHGSLVLGATIPEAFVMHHFEFACRGQIAALSAGYESKLSGRGSLSLPSTGGKEGEGLVGGKDWPACLRPIAYSRIPGIRPTQGITCLRRDYGLWKIFVIPAKAGTIQWWRELPPLRFHGGRSLPGGRRCRACVARARPSPGRCNHRLVDLRLDRVIASTARIAVQLRTGWSLLVLRGDAPIRQAPPPAWRHRRQ